eukprot:jgi/Bigna1/63717/fgenesh1_kg.58_\
MNGQVCCCNIKDACLCLRFKQVLLLFCANIACDCKVSCDELTCVQVPTALACCGCFCYNEEEVTGLY